MSVSADEMAIMAARLADALIRAIYHLEDGPAQPDGRLEELRSVLEAYETFLGREGRE